MENQESAWVIKLPKINLKTIFSLPFLIISTGLFSISLLAYWYVAIRPILYIKEARVETSFLICSTQLEGRIAQALFEEGDLVSKGDFLFQLEHESLLSEQKLLKEKGEKLQEQIAIEKTRMDQAMAQYLSASNTIGFESSDLIEKNVTILEQAQRMTEASTQLLSNIELEIEKINSEILKMKKKAPFDAIVLKKWKTNGETVLVGEPIYTLFDPKQIWVSADCSETHLHQLKVGLPVTITLTAYPQKKWSGKIEKLSPIAMHINQKPMIRIHASIDCGDFFLRPGLSAQMRIKTIRG